MDLPGHGNNTEVFGHIEKWDEIENSVEQAYKKLNQYDIKLVFGISFGGQVGLHCILKGIIDPDFLILSANSKSFLVLAFALFSISSNLCCLASF